MSPARGRGRGGKGAVRSRVLLAVLDQRRGSWRVMVFERGRLPKSHGLVPDAAAGRQDLAVGRNHDGEDWAVVITVSASFLARRDVPEANSFVLCRAKVWTAAATTFTPSRGFIRMTVSTRLLSSPDVYSVFIVTLYCRRRLPS